MMDRGFTDSEVLPKLNFTLHIYCCTYVTLSLQMVQILNYVYKTITTTLVSDIKLKKLSTKTVLNLCTVIWKLKKTVDVCVVTGLDIQQ